MNSLLIARAERISLQDALKTALPLLGDGAALIAYTPGSCAICVFDAAGKPVRPDGSPLGEDAYEARAFGSESEVRWLHDEGGHGRAVIVSESASVRDLPEPWQVDDTPVAVLGTVQKSYVLWGTGTGAADGRWSELAEPRVGALKVPVPGLRPGDRAALTALEYLAQEDDHGNVAVFDERLCGFESISA